MSRHNHNGSRELLNSLHNSRFENFFCSYQSRSFPLIFIKEFDDMDSPPIRVKVASEVSNCVIRSANTTVVLFRNKEILLQKLLQKLKNIECCRYVFQKFRKCLGHVYIIMSFFDVIRIQNWVLLNLFFYWKERILYCLRGSVVSIYY